VLEHKYFRNPLDIIIMALKKKSLTSASNSIEPMTKILRLLGHPLRLQTVFLLHQEGDLSAGDLCKHLKSEQTLMSHHLGDLRKIGILGARRDGKSIIYSLRYPGLPAAIQSLTQLSNHA